MEVSLGFQSMVVPPNHPVIRPWLSIDEQHLTTMMTWGSPILGNHIGFVWVICFPSIFQRVQTNGSLFSPSSAHPTRLGFQTGHDWARPSAPLGECCAMVSGSRGAQTQTWSYLRFQSCLIIWHKQIICKLYCLCISCPNIGPAKSFTQPTISREAPLVWGMALVGNQAPE